MRVSRRELEQSLASAGAARVGSANHYGVRQVVHGAGTPAAPPTAAEKAAARAKRKAEKKARKAGRAR